MSDARKLTLPMLGILLGSVVAGCDPNRVLFVTSTNVAIDADAKTQSVNIGYQRSEGFVGPAYSNGGVPPVAAHLESDLTIIDPKISQLYATGDAARIATGGQKRNAKKPLSGSRKLMFFGTETTWGLKSTFNTQGLASLTFGFKRQEFSLIPIGKEDKSLVPSAKGANSLVQNASLETPTTPELDPGADQEKEDVYASTLAAIDLNVTSKTFDSNGVGLRQFFATGDAAENLAAKQEIKDVFIGEAVRAIEATAPDPSMERWLGCQEKRGVAGRDPDVEAWLKSRNWGQASAPDPLTFATNRNYASARDDAVKHFCAEDQ